MEEAGRQDESALCLRSEVRRAICIWRPVGSLEAPDGKLEWDRHSTITTEPNELTAQVHNRMLLILKTQDYDRWPHADESMQLPIDLLRPFDADRMKSWKVDPRVGKVWNSNPNLYLEN